METKKFGARLRELREQAGLSQRELADKIGVNFTYLSKIESGVIPPPSERVILRLAEVLDTERDELMTLAGKIPSDIAQILKSRENWQFLRSGGSRKKSRSVNNKGSFNTRLKALREQAGLSQRELADKVGVNFTYLSKIEGGVVPPPSERVILRLAEVLDADRDELMTLAGKIPSDIAQMLKSRENWQSLRSGRTQKRVRATTEKGGVNMTRFLVKYKALSRVVLAIVLVSAIAASLWFTSPSPVRALDVAITDPQGQPLVAGTLGQTYYFQVKVTVASNELVPIEHIDLKLYNLATPSYNATAINLPLVDGGNKFYSNNATGGGGTVNVTAAAPQWNWLFGKGRAMWQSNNYTFFGGGYGYGFAGPASITYAVAWQPPAGWPQGNYRINTQMTAGSNTFTEVSTQFTLMVGLLAETGISQGLNASNVTVVKVNINRIKDLSGNTTPIPDGIGSYTATVSSNDSNSIQFLAVNGVSPFDGPSFNATTGVFSVVSVSSPIQANNTPVANVVPILTGSTMSSVNLTVAFQAIGAAGAPGLNVSEEHANSLVFRRGDTDGGGTVDIGDASWIAQYVVGMRTINQLNGLNAASVSHGDASGDLIDIGDASWIAQLVVGMRDSYFQSQ